MLPAGSGDAIHGARVGLYIMPELLTRSDIKTWKGRTKCPGGLKRPGLPRTCAHARFEDRADTKPIMASRRTGAADGIIYVIYTFRRGEEGFNGLSTIKTDIYFARGWVCSAASSIS